MTIFLAVSYILTIQAVNGSDTRRLCVRVLLHAATVLIASSRL